MLVVAVEIAFLIIVVTILATHLFGAPYVPSTHSVIKRAIELSQPLKGKKVVDLGSGDGRVVDALMLEGAEAHGYEINPFLIVYSKLHSPKGKFHLKNFWKEDLRKFDVVYAFGISYIMLKLEDKLKKELKKGAKVVLYSYEFPNWEPILKDGSVCVYEV